VLVNSHTGDFDKVTPHPNNFLAKLQLNEPPGRNPIKAVNETQNMPGNLARAGTGTAMIDGA